MSQEYLYGGHSRSLIGRKRTASREPSDDEDYSETTSGEEQDDELEPRSSRVKLPLRLSLPTTAANTSRIVRQLRSQAGICSKDDPHVGGVASFLPSIPGLFIQGVGRVTLPLIDRVQADAIVAVCEQSPVSKGPEAAALDTTLRNSFELPPAKFRLENPGWENGIKKTAALVAKELGIEDTPVDLHLHKLLLYRQGGHFAKHRDTEQYDRMFATLVIQLPSDHTGGDLLVYPSSSSSTSMLHSFGKEEGTAAYQCHYAAHHADVEHEVTKVTKGYRLVLVYAVCWPEGQATPRSKMKLGENAKSASVKAMQWLAEKKCTFHCVFDHAYTAKSMRELGVAALKGQDRHWRAVLQSINASQEADSKYVFFLGQVDGQETVPNGASQQQIEAKEKSQQASGTAVHSIRTLAGSLVADKLKGRLAEADRLNSPRKTAALDELPPQRDALLYDERPAKDAVYHKYVLLAFPCSTDLVEPLSASAACHALADSHPTFQSVETFLKRLADSDSAGRGGAESMRSKLLHCILAQPSPAQLFQYYLRLYPGIKMLGGARPWPSKTGLQDFFAIASTETLWADVATRSAVVDALGADEKYTLAAVRRCLNTEVASLVVWRFGAILEKWQGQALSADQLDDAEFQEVLWSVALSDRTLCTKVVQRCLATEPKKLKVAVGVLVPLCKKDSSLLENETGQLRPLFDKYVQGIIDDLVEISAEARGEYGWAMPFAVFPAQPEVAFASRTQQRSQVEAFLRGPDRKLTTYGFPNVQAARASAARQNTSPQANCSYVAVGDGRGKDAYLTIEKTDKHFRRRAQEEKGLVVELGELRRLMGVGREYVRPVVGSADQEKEKLAKARSDRERQTLEAEAEGEKGRHDRDGAAGANESPAKKARVG